MEASVLWCLCHVWSPNTLLSNPPTLHRFHLTTLPHYRLKLANSQRPSRLLNLIPESPKNPLAQIAFVNSIIEESKVSCQRLQLGCILIHSHAPLIQFQELCLLRFPRADRKILSQKCSAERVPIHCGMISFHDPSRTSPPVLGLSDQ